MLKKWLILILFLMPVLLFSQERPIVFPHGSRIISDPEEEMFERKVQHGINSFLNSGHISLLLKYWAARNDDLSLCRGGSECLETAQDILVVRYLAEGRCEEIEYETWGEKEFCRAIRDDSCSKMEGWRKDFCNGLALTDKNLMMKAASSRDFRRDTGIALSEDQAASTLALFSGFKHYSTLPCERFIKDEPMLPEQLTCEILFSPYAREAYDSIIRDIAIFNISKEEINPDLCDRVKNPKIKKHCLDRKVKKLYDVW